MHIGVLTHNYPRFPGDFSGTFIEALCAAFAAHEQQVTVWAPYDPAYRQNAARGGAHSSQSPTPNAKIDLRLYRYIWPDRLHQLGYMRSMQSDLALRLNSYLLSPGFFAAGIARVVRDAGQCRPDVLHAHWLLPNGFIAAIASRRLGIPLVISVPGSDAQVAGKNPLFRAMARFALRQADLLTANSVELREAVVQIGAQRAQGSPEEALRRKFDLIIYGTDPNALKPDQTGVEALRAKLNLPISQSPKDTAPPLSAPPMIHPAITLLCVGRMVPKKGFDVLIRALAEPSLRERNIVAVMIGEGDDKAAWQQLAQELGVAEQLRWVGNVPKTEIGVYYNLADVLINPSVNRPVDGLNVCVLDAMSCGKPVIGSTVAGNPLAIVDGETGFIVPEGDPGALAAAIARLADDDDLRARLGAAARRRIETELGWPHLARRYLDHFEHITMQRRTASAAQSSVNPAHKSS
jgi:glycosyltransferase involved in cell wall biosynthesis